MLPLYHANNAPEKPASDANTGLWYDKFCNVWNKSQWVLGEAKTNWISTVTGVNTGSVQLISELKNRLAFLAVARSGSVSFYKTEGRFVTGIGREHPVENGFSWHQILGAPFLPGSSVKGIVRAWAVEWLGENKMDIYRIFGPEGTANKNTGSVIFFDALPCRPVKLECDVMTPHYSGYYQNSGPPGDWYSPVPIPFLTVAAGQSFIFALAPRRTYNTEDQEDARKAAIWLEEALANIGAGAKTAVGYGRFVPDVDANIAWQNEIDTKIKEAEREKQAQAQKIINHEKEETIAAMSLLRREMELDGYGDNPDKFMDAMSKKWLSRMENTPREEQIEIAQLLVAWYQEKKPDQWSKPNQKNKKKITRIMTILHS